MKVAGISMVHGDTWIDITDRTARELVSILERETPSFRKFIEGLVAPATKRPGMLPRQST